MIHHIARIGDRRIVEFTPSSWALPLYIYWRPGMLLNIGVLCFGYKSCSKRHQIDERHDRIIQEGSA